MRAHSVMAAVLVGAFLTQPGSATPAAAVPPPGDPVARVAKGPRLVVDVAKGKHRISPLIYGVNFAQRRFAKDVDLPVDRWGGNSTDTYNWQVRGSNHAADWYEDLIHAKKKDVVDPWERAVSDNFYGWAKEAYEHLGFVYATGKIGRQLEVIPVAVAIDVPLAPRASIDLHAALILCDQNVRLDRRQRLEVGALVAIVTALAGRRQYLDHDRRIDRSLAIVRGVRGRPADD